MKILQKARKEHELRNAWTQDGKILVWDSVNERVKLCYIIEVFISGYSPMLDRERISFIDFCFILLYFRMQFNLFSHLFFVLSSF